jgi:hypothetical protein
MKTLATVPNVRKLIVDYLTPALITRGEDVTVGIDLPGSWTVTSKPHILVALDGTPGADYPIVAAASIRITAYCATLSQYRAEHLSTLCQGILLAHPGGGGISGIRFLSGALPAKDPDTKAAMSFVAVRVNLRYSVTA